MLVYNKREEKLKRQRYIFELEKVSKRIFRMLKEEKSKEDIYRKIKEIRKGLKKKECNSLESNYHKGIKEYIENIYKRCRKRKEEEAIFLEEERHKFNKLDKMKNATKYKREKSHNL